MKLSELPFTYFCTGARNQTLLSLFNTESLSLEIDERAASFKALGFAKSTKQPVAICTTSGTAVSECLSAMVEAYYSDVPLLLITGDRPARMQKTGAPQTINHEIISREYRRTFLEVSTHELQSLDFSKLSYPAHINVIIENENEIDSSHAPFYENSWDGFELFLKEHPRPLILVSHESDSMRDFVKHLIQTGIPFYAETLSQGHDLSTIKYETDCIKLINEKLFTSVIRIGHTPLSKAWRLLEKKHLPTFSFDSRGLGALSYGALMKYSSKELTCLEKWKSSLAIIKPFTLPQKKYQDLNQLLIKYPHSELSFHMRLQGYLPERSHVFIGNSLSIRFFEMIQTRDFKIFANRGANGIDGQLSTAIGLAHSTSEIVYCILGDITTQYDLSSLASIPQNLKLIILNNFGGQIFNVMKMNPRMIMEHGFNFEKITHAFGLTYARNDFEFFNSVQVFEVNPSNFETLELLRSWEA